MYVKVELLNFINEELEIILNVSFYVLFYLFKIKKLLLYFLFKPLVYRLVLVKITPPKIKATPIKYLLLSDSLKISHPPKGTNKKAKAAKGYAVVSGIRCNSHSQRRVDAPYKVSALKITGWNKRVNHPFKPCT